jgi:hypothetical protein
VYSSHQMLRVHHDEWLRYAETRRMIKRAQAETRASSAKSARSSARRPQFRLGRLVGQS